MLKILLSLKVKSLLLLAISLLLFAQTVQAHFLGGEMRNSYIGNNKVIVYVSLYRSCMGISNNITQVQLNFHIGTQNSSSCGKGTAGVLKLKNIRYNNLTCPTQKVCYPQNTYGTGIGAEIFEYYDTIDLSQPKIDSLLKKSTCPNITFFIDVSRRGTGTAINYNIILNSTLYLQNLKSCDNNINYAPEFVMPSMAVTNENAILAGTIGALDRLDNDQLITKLSTLYSTNNTTPLKYPTGYSYLYPVECFCPTPVYSCKPNPTANPPRGFYLDTLTGNYVYYQTTSTSANSISVTVSEYRLNKNKERTLISSSANDFLVWVYNTVNAPPTIEMEDVYTLIAGDSTTIKLEIKDVKTSLQTTDDTLITQYYTNLPNNFKVLKNQKSKTSQDFEIKITSDTSQYSAFPYRFNILAHDNQCPNPNYISKQIRINIKQPVTATLDIKQDYCNSLKLKANINKTLTGDIVYTWFIIDSATREKISITGNNIRSSYLTNGTKYIGLSIEHERYGFKTLYDTIHLYSKPSLSYNGKQTLCANDTLDLLISAVNMTQNKLLLWSKDSLLFDTLKMGKLQLKTTENKPFKLYFVGIDSLACFTQESKTIAYHQKPKNAFLPLPNLCDNSTPFNLSFEYPLEKNQSVSMFDDNYIVLPNNVGDFEFFPSNIPPAELNKGYASKKFYTLITDSTSCKFLDSAEILVNKSPQILLEFTDTLCQNLSVLDLNKFIIQPKANQLNGLKLKWTLKTYPLSVTLPGELLSNFTNDSSNRKLNLGPQKQTNNQGNYRFELFVTSPQTGCSATANLSFYVKNEPNITYTNSDYCVSNVNIPLFNNIKVENKTPKNGTFKAVKFNGSNMNTILYDLKLINDQILPAKTEAGLWEFSYVGPNTRCPDTAWLHHRIKHTPKAAVLMRNDTLLNIHAAHLDIINNSFIGDETELSYLWNPGTGNSSDISTDENFKFSYPKAIKEYNLKLVVNSIYNCSDSLQQRIFVSNNTGLEQPQLSDFARFSSNNSIEILKGNLQQINWYDATGKIVQSGQSLTFNPAVPGIYFYEIQILHQGKVWLFKGKKGI